MINHKCLLAYRGTAYFGFQKTKMGPSIEQHLQKALETVLKVPIQVQAASRTDRGVHAEEQVCNFFAPPIALDQLKRSLKGLLPKDISPLELKAMPNDFHPTLDAKGKEYHYYVCNDPAQLPFHREFSWHVPLPLDIDAMRRAAPLLLGTKDFSAFTNMRYEDPVRTLTAIAIEPLPDNRLLFRIQGENFLYKMVRNLVGTLIYIGLEKIPPEELPLIITSKDRKLSGITAPAHGLFLHRVFY